MRTNVIGQTGKGVLSDGTISYRREKKRTVRYMFTKMSPKNWMAWVCGPFHSRTYGVCSFGTNKGRARAALKRRLADDYGYIGRLLLSVVDDADKVGDVDTRLWDDRAAPWPITKLQACGSAGQ